MDPVTIVSTICLRIAEALVCKSLEEAMFVPSGPALQSFVPIPGFPFGLPRVLYFRVLTMISHIGSNRTVQRGVTVWTPFGYDRGEAYRR